MGQPISETSTKYSSRKNENHFLTQRKMSDTKIVKMASKIVFDQRINERNITPA